MRVRISVSGTRMPPIVTPNTWRPRNHPFMHAYSVRSGLMDLRPLYYDNTGFFRSHEFLGLQIADICAHTICRHHRGDGAKSAYAKLRAHVSFAKMELKSTKSLLTNAVSTTTIHEIMSVCLTRPNTVASRSGFAWKMTVLMRNA